MSVRARSSSSVTENKLRILQKQKHTHTYTLFITIQRQSNTSSERWTPCSQRPGRAATNNHTFHLFLMFAADRVRATRRDRDTERLQRSHKEAREQLRRNTNTESQRHESTAKIQRAGKAGLLSVLKQECELSCGVCADPQPGRGSSSQMVQTFSPNQIFSPPPVSQRLSPVI